LTSRQFWRAFRRDCGALSGYTSAMNGNNNGAKPLNFSSRSLSAPTGLTRGATWTSGMSDLQAKTILIIDDDPYLLDLMAYIFEHRGARVCTALDGEEGLCQLLAHQPDLVLLDLMMPLVDGWQVCQQLRQHSDVPIIILSVLGQDQDIVRGLDCGADDYLVKPVSLEVLLARARAMLRRVDRASAQEEPNAYSDGYLTIDLRTRRVVADDVPVRLSPMEYQLLAYLFRNAGRTLTVEEILEAVWGPGGLGSPEYIHVYISHLRQKLEQDAQNPQYLLNEHGMGYRFERKAP
jgi:two-component system KDP operon response regulator KdpE